MGKVLIIEDESFLRQTIASKLRAKGFEVVETDNGKDGLETALSSNPDLILLDLVLPSVDGLSLLTHLKQDETGKDIPVIILTNLAEDDKVKAAENLGAQAYVVKASSNLEDIVTLSENEINKKSSGVSKPAG